MFLLVSNRFVFFFCDFIGNQISDSGATLLEKSLSFNSSLKTLRLEGNKLSEKKLKEIEKAMKRRASVFNLVSVYLLGYGDTGKTTLRSTFKNLNFFTKNMVSKAAKTTKVNERTKGLEVDKRIKIGENFMQVIDFGGQHHYHHSTHLFTRGSRAAFIILVNPFEEGFQEQLLYWLRLLTLKATSSSSTSTSSTTANTLDSPVIGASGETVSGLLLPQTVIVFSRRDECGLSGGKEKEKEGAKEKELEELVRSVAGLFKERVKVTGWIWMDCTQTKNKELERFFSILSSTVSSVMDEFQMAVPDTSTPEKIMKSTPEIFYERKELEGIITGLLKLNDTGGGEEGRAVASNWIDSLLRSQDFFAIQIKESTDSSSSSSSSSSIGGTSSSEPKQFICTDLQRFGKDLLSTLIELSNENKSEWTQTELEGKMR